MVDTFDISNLKTVKEIDAAIERLQEARKEAISRAKQEAVEAAKQALERNGLSADNIGDLFRNEISSDDAHHIDSSVDKPKRMRTVIVRGYMLRNGDIWEHTGGPRKGEGLEEINEKAPDMLDKLVVYEYRRGIDAVPTVEEDRKAQARKVWADFDGSKMSPVDVNIEKPSRRTASKKTTP